MWLAKEMWPSNGSEGWPRPPGRDRSRKRTLRKLLWHRKPVAERAKHLRISRTSTTGPACLVVHISSRSLNLYSACGQDCSARSRRDRILVCSMQKPNCKISIIRVRATRLQGRESSHLILSRFQPGEIGCLLILDPCERKSLVIYQIIGHISFDISHLLICPSSRLNSQSCRRSSEKQNDK